MHEGSQPGCTMYKRWQIPMHCNVIIKFMNPPSPGAGCNTEPDRLQKLFGIPSGDSIPGIPSGGKLIGNAEISRTAAPTL